MRREGRPWEENVKPVEEEVLVDDRVVFVKDL